MNNEKMYSHIESEVEAVLPEAAELRREIHRNPELRFEEEETTERIRDFLSGSGLEFNPPYLGTDVTGLLRGGAGQSGAPASRTAPTVILRADMDALPIEDASDEETRSRRSGRAHACGHDGHTAVLAGTLKLLSRMRGRFTGDVGFIFQPGEEEGMGACKLLEAGLFREGLLAGLTGPIIVALHGWPGMPAGSFASRPGPYMAAADRFVLTVTGAGGHGAMPPLSVDPVVASAELVLALQTIVSRKIDPTDPAVVTVGSIRGGTADNVIPDHVVLKGTIRSFDNRIQRTIKDEIARIAEGICLSAGCNWTISYSDSYSVLSNDPAVVEAARDTVVEMFGTDGWYEGDTPSMGAEDFACYLDQLPGAMIRLGMGEDSPSLHAPDFEFREKALKPAIAFLSAFSIKTLERL